MQSHSAKIFIIGVNPYVLVPATVLKAIFKQAGKDKIIIDETLVSDVLKGKGAGKLMLTKAVEFARAKGIKIIPLCPFAKSVFDKVKEFNDVLSQ